jgi:hypothetical protein
MFFDLHFLHIQTTMPISRTSLMSPARIHKNQSRKNNNEEIMIFFHFISLMLKKLIYLMLKIK